MKSLTLILILFCLLTSSSIDAGWHFVSPMPKARYEHDATLGPDGKIYVMGGWVLWYYHHGEFSNVVYDRGENEWTILEPVPNHNYVSLFLFSASYKSNIV